MVKRRPSRIQTKASNHATLCGFSHQAASYHEDALVEVEATSTDAAQALALAMCEQDAVAFTPDAGDLTTGPARVWAVQHLTGKP